jgi:hypothetical protein
MAVRCGEAEALTSMLARQYLGLVVAGPGKLQVLAYGLSVFPLEQDATLEQLLGPLRSHGSLCNHTRNSECGQPERSLRRGVGQMTPRLAGGWKTVQTWNLISAQSLEAWSGLQQTVSFRLSH